MEPYTLAHVAGHADFATTKRYVHPQPERVREAMLKANVVQGGHNIGQSENKLKLLRDQEKTAIH